jgi:hypothetical protein
MQPLKPTQSSLATEPLKDFYKHVDSKSLLKSRKERVVFDIDSVYGGEVEHSFEELRASLWLLKHQQLQREEKEKQEQQRLKLELERQRKGSCLIVKTMISELINARRSGICLFKAAARTYHDISYERSPG